MSRKPHQPPPTSPAETRARAEKAIAEGRFQAALELARTLYKQEQTPANRQLLESAYLGRARQQRHQGFNRDASTTLQASLQVVGREQSWVEQVAEELAACGEAQLAMQLLQPFPDSAAAQRALTRSVDAAIQQEAAGRKLLPETLHADFDRILAAFDQLAQGKDDAVRDTLQPIGLRSPFLEWKLFLRGLQAYYQHEDVRALENWQRLDANRTPARLAAPFRCAIDASYRAAQPPPTQQLLGKQLDRMQSSSLKDKLGELQKITLKADGLQRAFRQAEAVLPEMREQAPQLIPRLARCMYWAILSNGHPDDVPRYARVFGPHPDDPKGARLNALCFERHDNMVDAHRCWREFEQGLEKNPAWPPELAKRARALVWFHMGKNAAATLDESQKERLPGFLRGFFDRPERLSPDAEHCFQQSLKLVPDQMETHAALFSHYLDHEKDSKAEKAAEALLQHFPNHGPTLDQLGDLHFKRQHYRKALDSYQRAFQANPLDRRLRDKVATGHLFNARAHAESGDFDEARTQYQAALNMGAEPETVMCKWAVLEAKAGNPEKMEELLAKARDHAASPLAVAYSTLIETIRLKLPKLKKRFDQQFKEAVSETPTPVATVAAATTAAAYRRANVTYHGQKTHEKKVLDYVGRAEHLDFTEPQLEELCEALLALEARRLVRRFTHWGRARFPKNPRFPYFEAETYFQLDEDNVSFWQVRPLLEDARRLAEAMPHDERRQALLEKIKARQHHVALLNPFAGAFGGMPFIDPFGGQFGPGDYDDYDDDDDDDGYF